MSLQFVETIPPRRDEISADRSHGSLHFADHDQQEEFAG
jgi:hypothetical protein